MEAVGNNIIHSGRFGDEICAGILARRMDEPNYVVQYWSPPLVAFRVLVLPADPLLHSGPCTATETILTAVGKFRGREITSAIDQTMYFSWAGEETPRPSTFICSRFDRVHTSRATCFRVLILCCIVTPTDQLTHRLFYRLRHRLLQCVLPRLGHCGLCAFCCLASQSGASTTVCALHPLRCCSLHSKCFAS